MFMSLALNGYSKTDEDGEIIQNKSRLVAQGYTQVEGVDFD